jgi:hypothetical protein
MNESNLNRTLIFLTAELAEFAEFKIVFRGCFGFYSYNSSYSSYS